MILDEVGSEERSSPGVQGLEDDLRVIAWIQINGYDDETLPDDSAQCLEPSLGTCVVSVVQPHANSVSEEAIGLVDPMARTCGDDVAAQQFDEGDSVSEGRKYLQLIPRPLD